MEKEGKLVANSIAETKTAAGDFARGYRGKSFGRKGKPRGSVRVEPVGKYFGVFDYAPEVGMHYISIEEGEQEGKRRYGR